jgi:cell division protein ZapA (FtsZ GTPase activity inhibitor)
MDAETQEQLRELADKFIVRALEIESKSRTKLSGPR